MSRTTGDHNQAECPACGKIIRDLWTLCADRYEGTKIVRGHCEAEITVKAYVTLEPDKRKKGSDGDD